MKTNIFKAGLAMSLFLATFASCSDKIADDYAPTGKQVPLEVSVAGIDNTRAIVEGSTLPNNSAFYVYYGSQDPVRVSYDNGKCILNQPILLDETSGKDSVYAFYPTPTDLEKIPVVSDSYQDDYLLGIGLHANGDIARPNIDNPKVSIAFKHILARITINIHKDASVDDKYVFDKIYLGGDSENSYRIGQYNAKLDQFTYLSYYDYQNIPGEIKDDKNTLETPEDVITVDFIVIPSQTVWDVYIPELSSSLWTPLPLTNYLANKQYIFDCIIKQEDKPYLTITQCDIKPWDGNTIMPEIELK